MKKIMTRAWGIYRTLKGDHVAKLAMALKQAWKEAKASSKKVLQLKDWIFQKIAREHNAPRIWSANVDIIFAETEKAYKVMLGVVDYCVTTWVPKSQCFWESDDRRETLIVNGWEAALEAKKEIRSMYC